MRLKLKREERGGHREGGEMEVQSLRVKQVRWRRAEGGGEQTPAVEEGVGAGGHGVKGGRESWIRCWLFGEAIVENEKWLLAFLAHFLLSPSWFCVLFYLKWQTTCSKRGPARMKQHWKSYIPKSTCTCHLTVFHFLLFHVGLKMDPDYKCFEGWGGTW